MLYRREIDGLRALAILPVILFHAGAPAFSGGYAGVDIFFVISGYLITSILIKELDAGHFSLTGFYERRARRILPALFFVLICCLPFSLLWMVPVQLADFGRTLLATVFFVSNIFFAKEVDYFAPSAEERPLLHTWSLAVEEQFYIIFPLLLIALWRLGHRRVFLAIGVLTAVSLGAVFGSSSMEAPERFFSTHLRAWELLAGSLCAFTLGRIHVAANDALGLAGLGLIILSFFLIPRDAPFPSMLTLLPVGGAVLIVLFARGGSLVARLLSMPPLVGIGLISYSAYLWHQPLFALARIRQLEEPTFLEMSVLVLITLILAALTWHLVEQPFRKRGDNAPVSLRILARSSMAAAVVFLVFSLATILTDGAAQRYAGLKAIGYQLDNELLQQQSWEPLRTITGSADYSVDDNPADNEPWLVIRPQTAGMLIVGNSHAKDLYNVLTHSKTVAASYSLARYGVQIRALVSDHPFFASPNYKAAHIIVLSSAYKEADVDALEKVATRIRADGKMPVFVTRSPLFDGNRETTLADSHVLKAYRDGVGISSPAFRSFVDAAHWRSWQHQKAIHEMNARITQIGRRLLVPVLDRVRLVCESESDRCASLSPSIEKYFYDQHHFTLAGASLLGMRVDAVDWLSPIRRAARNADLLAGMICRQDCDSEHSVQSP